MKLSNIKNSSGFTLIEVLISILILSVAFLGIAALQVNALKNNQSSLQRSQAIILSYYMMDSMRANPIAAVGGAYNLIKTCTVPTADATLRTDDHIAWLTALKANMGDLNTTCGEISCNLASCTVTVYWDDSRASSGSNAQSFQIKSKLRNPNP